MKKLYFLLLLSMSLLAESKDLLMLDITRYDKTATSLSLKEAKLSYDIPAISYMHVDPNYLLIATLKVMPKQYIGTTALGNTPIELKKEAWKYELGAAYKFYLNEDLYIAPALLYSDYYSTLYQIIGSTVTESESHDSDLRLYGVLGYKLAKATMLFSVIELDNDILSDTYSDDYSQYPLSITLFQHLSKEWLIYFKYQQTLRDKKARADSTGVKNSISYGFGIGRRF